MGRKPAPLPKRANGTGQVVHLPKRGDDCYRLVLPDRLGGASKQYRGSEREANRELDVWMNDLESGRVVAGRVPTLAAWAQTYLDGYSANNHDVSTREWTASVVQAEIIGDPIGRIHVNALTISDVQSWLNTRLNRGLSYNTIRGYRRPLRHMMELASVEYRLPVNVVGKTTIPKNAQRDVRDGVWLTTTQARAFLDACHDPLESWGPFFGTCALLGVRPSEGLAIGYSDLMLEAEPPYVVLHHTIKRAKDRPVCLGPVKTARTLRTERNGERKVTLADEAVGFLKRQLDLNVEYAGVGLEPDDQWSDLIFLRNGQVPFMSSVRKALDAIIMRANRKLGEDCQLPTELTPYDFRRSCITILLDAGLDIDEVALMTGTSPDMIREHYRKYRTEVVGASAADVWNNL